MSITTWVLRPCWAALAEKAYAVANAFGYVPTEHEYQDSYAALNYGDPAALQAITGQSASDANINPSNIATAWGSNNLIVLGTTTPASSYIVGGHAYAVVGYDASSSTPFELFNPWGTDSASASPSAPVGAGGSGTTYGLFWANAAFISANFNYQSVGFGASTVNNVAGPVDAAAPSRPVLATATRRRGRSSSPGTAPAAVWWIWRRPPSKDPQLQPKVLDGGLRSLCTLVESPDRTTVSTGPDSIRAPCSMWRRV